MKSKTIDTETNVCITITFNGVLEDLNDFSDLAAHVEGALEELRCMGEAEVTKQEIGNCAD